MREILNNGLQFLEEIRGMEVDSTKKLIFFAVLFALGAINCILGYRLLRFWMMLSGFFIGALGAFYAARSMGDFDARTLLILSAVAGIIVAAIAFLVYRAGVFLVGAALGIGISLYLIHPTSSATFFLCILIGVVLGALALRFSREVIIIGTSLMGGVLAGFSLCKLLHRPEIPYGLAFCAGFSIVGMILQFLINRPSPSEEDEDEEDEDDEGDEDEDEDAGHYSDEEEEDEEIEWTDEIDDEFWRRKRRRR